MFFLNVELGSHIFEVVSTSVLNTEHEDWCIIAVSPFIRYFLFGYNFGYFRKEIGYKRLYLATSQARPHCRIVAALFEARQKDRSNLVHD